MLAGTFKGVRTRLSSVVLMTGLVLSLVGGSGSVSRPIYPGEFSQVAPQGFGDRQNSMAWSMIWWRGKLYVGTGRAYGCARQAIMTTYFSWVKYPPNDPEIVCTASPQDLPLQAEIWRLTPEAGLWERVYQAPTVPISDTGKTVGADIGYRDMTVFTEPDGTEALYVGGVSSRDFNPGVPLPRILRTVDGEHFEAIPQDPGTLLGDLDTMEGITITGFNRMEEHDGRLYVIAGGAFGHGVLLEAENPAAGNDSFRVVTPAGMTVTGAISYNGHLYVAQGSNPLPGRPPFQVLRTDPTGALPYTFTPVVKEGGYRSDAAKSVASLHVFDGKLWIGTNRPVEMIRINPDDSWDLIVGTARVTPEGDKSPLSGIADGFAWPFNIHLHQMADHEGWLYAATNDQCGVGPWHMIPWIENLLKPNYGFDMYATRDGWYMYMITRTGLELYSDSYSGRNMVSTSSGLYVGTMNDAYGLQMWRGEIVPKMVYLPLIARPPSSGQPAMQPGLDPAAAQISVRELVSPPRLQLDQSARGLVLSWQPVSAAASYTIYCADFVSNEQLGIRALDKSERIAGPFLPIDTTQDSVYLDTASVPGESYEYYVVAERPGQVSKPSNVVQAPVTSPAVTVPQVRQLLAAWTAARREADPSSIMLVEGRFDGLSQALASSDWAEVAAAQEQIRTMLTGDSAAAPSWRKPDIAALLDRLARRLDLARAGLIEAQDLLK